MNSKKIEDCIETVCQQGCKTVYACISDLERGYSNLHTDFLTFPEREKVLKELKAIMAVYGEGSVCQLSK